MSQDQLDTIGKRHGSRLTNLSIRQEYDSGAPKIELTEGLSEHFPALETLSLDCVDVTDVRLKLPALRCLSLENAEGVGVFSLDCPRLESLYFEFVTISDPSDFGASLSRSPMLESVCGYKLRGLGVDSPCRCHQLVLPQADRLDLHHSDDLDFLQLYAPNMVELNLQVTVALSNSPTAHAKTLQLQMPLRHLCRPHLTTRS